MDYYGKELIIDLHQCDVKTFTRKTIRKYFVALCDFIQMERCKLTWWDYKGYPEEYEKAPDHLKGISAVQFIKTSNITVHTLDVSRQILLNIFSCKDYNPDNVIEFSRNWFNGKELRSHIVFRGKK